MLKNVTGQETDTFDEVNKVLNRIIDNLNLIENKVLVLDNKATKNDSYNAEVEKYNENLLEPKKKGGK
jgi:hypothetical protein